MMHIKNKNLKFRIRKFRNTILNIKRFKIFKIIQISKISSADEVLE